MMLLDKTTERLRSKHVRTLELLQKTLDENVELRDRVSQLQKGTLHLNQAAPRSNRANELEDEIDRLKAEYCAKVMATEEAARVRHEELFKTITTLQTQHKKLQNDVFSLETRLFNARETLQHERAQWHQERQRLQHDTQTLQQEIEQNAHGHENSHERYQKELDMLQREAESLRLLQHDAETRNEQLREEISSLCIELKQRKDQTTDYHQQLDAANQQLVAAKQRETTLMAELAAERAQSRQRMAKASTVPQNTDQLKPPIVIVPHQQQQHPIVQSQLQQLEEAYTRVVGENRALLESLSKMQTHFAELSRQATTTTSKTPEPPLHSNTSSIFATHVDLKRENFNLRAQVEELKQLQRRFLTTANKKTMKFPPL